MSSDNSSVLMVHDTYAAGQACSLQQIIGHIEASSTSDNSVAQVKRSSAKPRRMAYGRSNETQTERDVRLVTLRKRAASRKLNETQEDRTLRLSVDAKRARLRKSAETEQKKTERLAKNAERARKRRLALAEQKRSSRLCGEKCCTVAKTSRQEDSPVVKHPTSSFNIQTPSVEGNHSETSAPNSATMVSENSATQASLEMETNSFVKMPAPYSILRAKGRRGDIGKITILNTNETQAHIPDNMLSVQSSLTSEKPSTATSSTDIGLRTPLKEIVIFEQQIHPTAQGSASVQEANAITNAQDIRNRSRRASTQAARRRFETESQRSERLRANEARRRRRTAFEPEEERMFQNQQSLEPLRERSTFGIATTVVVPAENYLGPLSVACNYCGALFFENEAKPMNGRFNLCCNFGNVNLDLFKNFPDFIRTLLTGNINTSKNFRQHIRSTTAP